MVCGGSKARQWGTSEMLYQAHPPVTISAVTIATIVNIQLNLVAEIKALLTELHQGKSSQSLHLVCSFLRGEGR